MPRKLLKEEELATWKAQVQMNKKENDELDKACKDQDTTRSKYGRRAFINQLREDGYDV